MRRHLPSRRESLELASLVSLLCLSQWLVGSWGFTALFALGFIWNWAVLNAWVIERRSQRRYRFSVLKGITAFHYAIVSLAKDRPKLLVVLELLPASVLIFFTAALLDTRAPVWAVFCGSLALSLTRRALSPMRQD